MKTREKSKIYYVTIAMIFAMCTFSLTASAGERYEFFNGIRSLGMGGAMVAITNDETALLANPAALGKLRNYFVTVLDPEGDIGEDTQSIVGTDIMKFIDPQETLDALEDKPRKRLHQRVQLFPSLVVPNFGFGVFAKYEANAFIDETGTLFNYDYTSDIAAVFGFNLRLFDGRIKIGVNARGVDRTTIRRDDIPIAQTGMSINSLAREGFGVGSDFGLMLAAPWTWIPTLAVVYRDVGHTHYTINKGFMNSTDDGDAPDATPPTLDAAIALFPIISNKTRMTFTVEMKDVLNQIEPEPDFEDEPTRRIHGGIEFNFSDAFFIRAGMNQNYWTAGLELAMFNYQLQLASYGEEVGTADDPQEDRRYVGKFAWRF